MAEAKENTVNEEPQVLTMTEKVDDVDVSKKYLVDDMSEDSKLIFNKMSVVQKSKSDIIANANFEVEKADILIAHYMEQLKDNLPEPMEDEEESANGGDKKPN
tara:strand:+ start:29 stop:337 length:309 start_codon:yes stop_codon:yes gene_type:complete